MLYLGFAFVVGAAFGRLSVLADSNVSTVVPRVDKCSTECNKHLFSTVRSALEGSTYAILRNYDQMCRDYADAKKCLDGISQCGAAPLYTSLTSGLAYMCDYQRAALEQTLPCVNEVLPDVQKACEQSCRPQSIPNGLVLKQLLQKDIQLLHMLDPHMPRITMNEACRVSKCFVKCFKIKTNIRCDGTAGSILTEGLVRPFSEVQQHGEMFGTMMGLFVPRQCGFLGNKAEIDELRIDPSLDVHLHDFYESKKQQKLEPISTPNPFKETEDLLAQMDDQDRGYGENDEKY